MREPPRRGDKVYLEDRFPRQPNGKIIKVHWESGEPSSVFVEFFDETPDEDTIGIYPASDFEGKWTHKLGGVWML